MQSIRQVIVIGLDGLEPRITENMLDAGELPNLANLRAGAWSDWLKLKFKVGPLMSVPGMARFFLIRTVPVFELYCSPINFDPNAPLFPISSPPEYAHELASRVGTFYTAGMAEEDGGLKNRRISEEASLGIFIPDGGETWTFNNQIK